MNADEQRIRELAQKWIKGTITDEERSEFMKWYDSVDDGRPLDVPEKFASDELTHGIRMLRNIYESSEIGKDNRRTRVPRFIRNWYRYAAALLIAAALGVFIYSIINKEPELEVVLKPSVKPVDVEAPASVYATITLNDGRRIVLDSIVNGTLARDAGFRKINDGQIIYEKPQVTGFSTLNNPRGSRVIQVTLSDGTRVWLNAESSIRYPVSFTGNSRTVEVTGQTYFEVAENSSMPFIVRKGAMEVTVTGTHFDVNAYDDEENIEVTLLEGSVSITASSGSNLRLLPGEQSKLATDGRLSKTSEVNTEEVVAWKNGKFDFGTKTELGNILRQVARWYNLQLEYDTTEKRYYGGSISREVNLSQVLKILETTGDVKFEVSGNRLRVVNK